MSRANDPSSKSVDEMTPAEALAEARRLLDQMFADRAKRPARRHTEQERRAW